MNLTVSIVLHNTDPKLLNRALECVLRASPKTIWLIDNSNDNSLSIFEKFANTIIYKHVDNRGFGAGHNIAIRESLKNQDGLHLVLNADVEWEGEILHSMTEYMDKHPDCGILAPEVFLPDGKPQWNARMLPSPVDLIARMFLPRNLAGRRLDRYEMMEFKEESELDAPYLLGCFMLFRNKALIDCGLFDERFFMYPEDIDITRRIHMKWRTVRWNKVRVTHQHEAASHKNLRMLCIHIINMVRYFNKWGWLSDPVRKTINCKKPF